MGIAKDGSFGFTLNSEELAKGLRPSKSAPRGSTWLTESTGAVGIEGVLQSLEDIEEFRIDTSALSETFPFPQLFILTNVAIVCGKTDIYEVNLSTGNLDHKLTVEEGITWSVVDFYDFIYMSNGKVAVVRNAEDQTWEISDELPIASAMCNYNGQVVIGAPDVERS